MSIGILIGIAALLTALFIWRLITLRHRKEELKDKLTGLYVGKMNDLDQGGTSK